MFAVSRLPEVLRRGDDVAPLLADIHGSLDLVGLKIGDAGAHALASALCSNSTITELHLGNNNIGDLGATSLADALRHNNTLSEIYLDSNVIRDEGVSSLVSAMQKNTTVVDLLLSSNEISVTGEGCIRAIDAACEVCP